MHLCHANHTICNKLALCRKNHSICSFLSQKSQHTRIQILSTIEDLCTILKNKVIHYIILLEQESVPWICFYWPASAFPPAVSTDFRSSHMETDVWDTVQTTLVEKRNLWNPHSSPPAVPWTPPISSFFSSLWTSSPNVFSDGCFIPSLLWSVEINCLTGLFT